MQSIKRAYQGEFKHLLSILRLAALDDRSYVAFPKKKFDYLFILKQLRAEGFIEWYEQRGELLLIGIKQTYWKSFQHPMKAFSEVSSLRINKHATVTSKQLKKLQELKGESVHYVISSDKNIISGQNAASKKVGGIPLFKIN